MLEGKPVTIFGDGTQQRSFTYVKDVVKANLLAATTEGTKGEVFNCASGIKVTIRELANMVAEILNIRDPQINYGDWTPGDIRVFEINNTKIRTQFGLNFLTDFHAGLEQTVVWAKNYFQKMPGFNLRS
jgi:nucleoside-diphosphate-sugar epimerase